MSHAFNLAFGHAMQTLHLDVPRGPQTEPSHAAPHNHLQAATYSWYVHAKGAPA